MTESEPQYDPVAECQRWIGELARADKEQKPWVERSKKIVRRYVDERDTLTDEKRFNILWANVQTLKHALYAKTPKASVKRRFNDKDPVGRVACMILSRALDFENEHYQDFDAAILNAVEDRLLPGRGTAWVRYEVETNEPELSIETGEEAVETIANERTPVDYVYWQDFRMSPARTWEEVEWVARCAYMTRSDLEKRFEDGSQIPLDHAPTTDDDKRQSDDQKRAEIWEIWCKSSKRAYWLSKSYPKCLDIREDPLKLNGFFPCPKPLLSTCSTSSLIPVPDYVFYQDQARDLDQLTTRLSMLTKSCKVTGLYAGEENKTIGRMFQEGFDNQLFPVDSWAAFAERGGIQGNIAWMPIDQIVNAIQQLTARRQQMVAEIYELTGMADIIRGQSDAQETLGAQELKANYASLRLKGMQKKVAQFATEILQIKGEIMANYYSPETLLSISGIDQTDEGADPQKIAAALQLLRNEPLKNFRIEVAADSLVELDERQEQQEAVAFLSTVGGFLQQAVTAVKTMPSAAPAVGAMLLYAVRRFPQGMELESKLEEMLHAVESPPPDDGSAKADAEIQKAHMKAQVDTQVAQIKAQAQTQIEMARAQAQMEIEKAREGLIHEREQAKMQMQMAVQQQKNEMEAQIIRWKAELEASTKVNVAQITSGAQLSAQQDAAADVAASNG